MVTWAGFAPCEFVPYDGPAPAWHPPGWNGNGSGAPATRPLVWLDLDAPVTGRAAHVFWELPLTRCVAWYGATLPTEAAVLGLFAAIATALLWRSRHGGWPHRLYYASFVVSFAVRAVAEAVMATMTWAPAALTVRAAMAVGAWNTIYFHPFNVSASLCISLADLLLAYYWSKDGNAADADDSDGDSSSADDGSTGRRVAASHRGGSGATVTRVQRWAWRHRWPLLVTSLVAVVAACLAADVREAAVHAAAIRTLPYGPDGGADVPVVWTASLTSLAAVFLFSSATHVYCFVRWYARLQAALAAANAATGGGGGGAATVRVVRPLLHRALVIGGTTAAMSLLRAAVILVQMIARAGTVSGHAALSLAYFFLYSNVGPFVVMVAFVGLIKAPHRGTSSLRAAGADGDSRRSSVARRSEPTSSGRDAAPTTALPPDCGPGEETALLPPGAAAVGDSADDAALRRLSTFIVASHLPTRDDDGPYDDGGFV